MVLICRQGINIGSVTSSRRLDSLSVIISSNGGKLHFNAAIGIFCFIILILLLYAGLDLAAVNWREANLNNCPYVRFNS